MEIDDLEKRYTALYGPEPTAAGAVEEIERALSLKLPNDFRDISRFYAGGIIGGISLNAISAFGPATNIVEETIRLRTAVGLPQDMLVLGELSESIIVMGTDRRNDSPVVIWCDSTDVRNLTDLKNLRSPHTWNSYSDFFDFVLREDEDERRSAHVLE